MVGARDGDRESGSRKEEGDKEQKEIKWREGTVK